MLFPLNHFSVILAATHHDVSVWHKKKIYFRLSKKSINGPFSVIFSPSSKIHLGQDVFCISDLILYKAIWIYSCSPRDWAVWGHYRGSAVWIIPFSKSSSAKVICRGQQEEAEEEKLRLIFIIHNMYIKTFTNQKHTLSFADSHGKLPTDTNLGYEWIRNSMASKCCKGKKNISRWCDIIYTLSTKHFIYTISHSTSAFISKLLSSSLW